MNKICILFLPCICTAVFRYESMDHFPYFVQRWSVVFKFGHNSEMTEI